MRAGTGPGASIQTSCPLVASGTRIDSAPLAESHGPLATASPWQRIPDRSFGPFEPDYEIGVENLLE
jgi:hypothetical protein